MYKTVKALIAMFVVGLCSCKSTRTIETKDEITEVTTGVVASVTIDSAKTDKQENVKVETAKEYKETSSLIIKAIDENGELRTIRTEEYSRHREEKTDSTAHYKFLYERLLGHVDSLSKAETSHYEHETFEKKKKDKSFNLFELLIIIAGLVVAALGYVQLNRRE